MQNDPVIFLELGVMLQLALQLITVWQLTSKDINYKVDSYSEDSPPSPPWLIGLKDGVQK